MENRIVIGLGVQNEAGQRLTEFCQEKGAVSPQETEPDFPVSVQESPVEAWVDSGLLRGPGTEHNNVCTSPFEGHHYHNYPYHSLPQVKQQGENTAPSINRELD